MNKIEENKIIYLLLALIIILGGVIGGFIFEKYYNQAVGTNHIIDPQEKREIIIRDAKNIVIEQDTKVQEIADSAVKSYMGIFKLKLDNTKEKKEVSKNILENYYDLQNPEIVALIITSDGWLLIPTQLLNPKEYIAISQDKKSYTIDKTIVDPLTGYMFIHINGRDLTIQKFAENKDIKIGQTVLAVNWLGEIWQSSISENQNKIITKKSEDYFQNLKINNQIPKNFFGIAMYSLSGNCIGLIDKNGNVKPISIFNTALKSFLATGKISRAYLGIEYANLKYLFDQNDIRGINGSLVMDIASSSPVGAAGILPDDIITAIENISLAENDLATVVGGFSAGDKILIEYYRENKKKEVEIEVGSK